MTRPLQAAAFIIPLLAACASVHPTSPSTDLSATTEDPNFVFRDELLDQLVGHWSVTGTVHGNPSTQTLEAQWVLHHQFLRVYETSLENVAGTDVPYEGVFYFGHDSTSNRYVVHLMNVFGGRDSEGLGFGERHGNEIGLTFENLDMSISSRFIWEPEHKRWRILSQINGAGEGPAILDLVATR